MARHERREFLACGQRVRVKIADPKTYAYGCAERLDGKLGHVERTNAHYSDGLMYLVKFDTPAAKWWENSSPVESFWFPLGDLEVIGGDA